MANRMARPWDDLPTVPPPTKLAEELPERRHPNPTSAMQSLGRYAHMDGIIDEITRRLDQCSADICALHNKQEEMSSQQAAMFKKRQDELDMKHRNQIDCISDRIFDAEKQLSEAQKRQDEALRAASAAFDCERENLMSVIGQVNRNFDHLTSELANNSSEVKGMELKMDMLERNLEAQSNDLQVLQDSQAVVVRQSLRPLEQLLHNQQAHSSRLENELHEHQMLVERVAPECSDCKNRLIILAGQLTELQTTVSSTESSLSMVLEKLAAHEERRWFLDTSRDIGANPPLQPLAPAMVRGRGPLDTVSFHSDGQSQDEIDSEETNHGQTALDALNFAWAASQQGKTGMPRGHKTLPRQAADWNDIDMHPHQQVSWGSLHPPNVEQSEQAARQFTGPDASCLPNVALRL